MSDVALSIAPHRDRRLLHVETFRAVTALAIAFGHAQYDALIHAQRAGTAFSVFSGLPRGVGVDLFLVLAGFVAVLANKDNFGRPSASGAFLLRRLVRLVPLYWLASAAYIAFSLLLSSKVPEYDYSFSALFHNALFLPFDSYHDNFPRPIYSVAWSLSYVVFFSAIFAGALTLQRARGIMMMTAFLALGVTGNQLAPAVLPLGHWFKPVVLELLVGAVIAELYISGLRLPRLVSLVLLVVGIGVLIQDPMHSHAQLPTWSAPLGAERFMAWGVPSALIFAAVILARASLRPITPPQWLNATILSGAAISYSLYLSHPFVIIFSRKLLQTTGLLAFTGWWGHVALCLGLSLVVAKWVHHHVEKPVTERVSAWLYAYPSLARFGKASNRSQLMP